MIELNKIYNEDCLDTMSRMSDNSVDLILTDPPYGINIAKTGTVGASNLARVTQFKKSDWDSQTPDKKIFKEMIRISKNQVIFGGNYFVEYLKNSSCWLVWNKDNGKNNFADCELAWTSFNSAIRIFNFRWQGMLQQNMKEKERRYHPTQKPIQLFSWILNNYSKSTDIIYDPFGGSGTTGVASIKLGRQWIISEIDKDYCDIANKRTKEEMSQGRLF